MMGALCEDICAFMILSCLILLRMRNIQTQELFHLPTLMHNYLFINNMYSYTTILDMFQALTCPSSGGPVVFSQHLVTLLSVNGCTVHRCTVQPFTERRYQML
jgi:hypothetical protein